MHIHVGLVHGLTIFATVVIFGFLWRVTAGLLHDTSVGQAMAFIY